MKTFDYEPYLTKLRRELRKLENAPVSPIARRNGRRRVLSAARLLRVALDEAYPPIVDRTGVKRLKTFAGRLARMRKAGWVVLEHAGEAADWVAAGVRIKKLEHTDDGDEKKGRPGVHHSVWLIPAWARAIGRDKARLREAKRSRKIRAAAITAEALT